MKRAASLLLSLLLITALFSACSTDDPGESGGQPGDTGGSDGNMSDVVDTGDPEDTGTDVPDGDSSCTSDADCPEPEVCALDTSTGELSCQESSGGTTGDSCSTGADCASGICLNGTCADTCAADGDCPSGYACETQSIPLDGGGTADVDVCVQTDQPCASDEDCTAPEICTVDRSGSSTELTCGDPVGGGELGDSCTDDSECASNLCIEGECSAPCERTADCNDGNGFKCEPTEIDLGSGDTETQNVCRPKAADECSSDSDCPGSDRCIAEKTATQIEFRCGTPNSNGGESGDDCSADADCAQNLCVDTKCAGPCASQGDCSVAGDYNCEITDVELTNGSDNAEICVPPRPCANNAECLVDEVCTFERTNSGVESNCGDGNAGGGELGEICTDDANCEANLCYDGRFGQVCSNPCQDDADCPTPGYECVTTDVADASGAQSSAQICAPEDPPSCDSQNDCASGLSCAIIENGAGNALLTACIPSAGGKGTGVACTDDAECASRVCLNGTCSAPCVDDNECGQAQLCQTNNISKSGLTGTFDVCETLPDERCDDDGTCNDSVRICSDIRIDSSTTQREAYCRFPVSGGQPVGSVCGSGSDCRSGFCVSGLSDECSVACVNDGQCTTSQVCTGLAGAGSANICVRGCTDNDDCSSLDTSGEEHICTINGDSNANEIDQICTQKTIVDPNNPSAGDLGAPCSVPSDCQTSMCLTNTTYNGVSCTSDSQCDPGQVCDTPPSGAGRQCADQERLCTRICDGTSDCSGGVTGNPLTACSPDVTVSLQNGTTGMISACAKP